MAGSPPCSVAHTSHMQGVHAEEDIAAYEATPQQAEHLPGLPQHCAVTMNDHDCRDRGACQEPALYSTAPEGKAVPSPPEQDPGELLRRLSALNLAEGRVPSVRGHRYGEHRRTPLALRNHLDAKLHFPDASYPEPLSTEGSPRRRARSLPWNSIPEADVEDEDDSLLCCCRLKKRVQFADSIGLCLASIKHFLPSDEPLVPQAVLARLQSYPPTLAVPRPELDLLEDMCESECPIPAELLARLEEQQVCLEQVSASAWGVKGHILVQDPGQDVKVKVRYTFNEWLSFMDCPASAAQHSPAHGTQRFHFSLCYPPATSLIHFAICFTTSHGQEIWDNNLGVNYTVSCQQNLPPVVKSSSPEEDECEGPQHW